MKQINAAFLVRVSTDHQEFESQIDQLNRIISLDDDNVVVTPDNIYAEKISGYTDTRETIEQLKLAIEKGSINRVYCIELTRLSRKPHILINLYEWFNEKKCPIFFVNENMWTINPQTMVVDNDTRQKIYGAALWGEQELNKIKLRTSRGRILKAKQGYYVGHVAFGYQMQLAPNSKDKLIVINKNEADIVKQVFEKIAYEGATTTQVTKWLNSENIKSKWVNWVELNGNKKLTYKSNSGIERKKADIKWTYSSVKQLLKNRWYIGERIYKGYILKHDAIINNDLFELANNKLKINKKIDNGRRTDRIYCLSNIFFCGKCGRSMNAHTTHTSSTYYCSSKETGHKCGDIGISKENIEMAIIKLVSVLATREDQFIKNYLVLEHSGIVAINSQIEQLNRTSANLKKTNETLINQITNLTIEKTTQTILDVKISLQNKINDLTNQYNANIKLINENRAQSTLLEEQLNNKFDVKTVINKINESKDLTQIAIILHELINKVTLYNVDSNAALIHIDLKSQNKINMLYFRRKTSFNLDLIYELKDSNELDYLDSTKLNTPQQIYYFTDEMIKYNAVDKEFKLQVTNLPNTLKALTIEVYKSTILELNQVVSLLYPLFSFTYDLFYSVDSPEYLLRKQRYKELTKGMYDLQIKNGKNKPVRSKVQIIKEFDIARKQIYNVRYKIKNSQVLSDEQKSAKLEKLNNELNQLKLKYQRDNNSSHS